MKAKHTGLLLLLLVVALTGWLVLEQGYVQEKKENKSKDSLYQSIKATADAKQDSINLINERLEKERQKCEKWYIANYVDDFGDLTGKKFIGFSASGSFSNSATSNSNLNVKILVDKNDFGIELMEYRDNPVAYIGGTNKIDIRVKSSSGRVTEFTGKMSKQLARLYINEYSKMIRMFKYSSGDVKFIIRGGNSKYNFSVSADCFNKKYNPLAIEKNKEIEKSKNLLIEKRKVLNKLMKDIELEKLSKNSYDGIKTIIERDLGLNNNYGTGESYKSIGVNGIIGPKGFEGNVEIYYILEDGTQKKIGGNSSWHAIKGAPVYERVKKLEEKREQTREQTYELEKERILLVLEKFKIKDLKEFIFEKIIYKRNNTYIYNFELSDIKNVFLTFNGTITGAYIRLELYDNKNINLGFIRILTEGQIQLSLEDLHNMGARLDKEF